MIKTKSAHRIGWPALEAGQVWRMAEAHLRVDMVGKLLVHYKLGKPNAIRVANSINSIKTIAKYLPSNS